MLKNVYQSKVNEVVLVHAMKVWGSEGKIPHITKLSSRWS